MAQGRGKKVTRVKKILITGANSYIGTSFEMFVEKKSLKLTIDTLDLLDKNWEMKDFSDYDVIFHVAAIVHQNESKVSYDLYHDVNTILPLKIAQKARKEGCSQFIFLSSMSVFGMESGIISSQTPLLPNTKYGKSKLAAENELIKLSDGLFKVAIVRPPMVYGKNCSGNYAKLSKMIKKIPFFIASSNQRSMIYIENLCNFISILIQTEKSGYFHPQNDIYVNTTQLVSQIAKVNRRKIILCPLPKFLLSALTKISTFNKLFSDLYYEKNMTMEIKNYNVCSFEESIVRSEEIDE